VCQTETLEVFLLFADEMTATYFQQMEIIDSYDDIFDDFCFGCLLKEPH